MWVLSIGMMLRIFAYKTKIKTNVIISGKADCLCFDPDFHIYRVFQKSGTLVLILR